MMITSQASERLVWCDFIGGESEGSLRLVRFFFFRGGGISAVARHGTEGCVWGRVSAAGGSQASRHAKACLVLHARTGRCAA